MGKKFVSMLLVVVLLTGVLPVGMMPNTKAASLLTFEAAQKYKGIIAAEESRISVLQEDGTVNEMIGEKTEISDWKGISSMTSLQGLTAGLKKDGTVVVTYGYPHELFKQVADWKDIQAISAADTSMMGLKKDGTVVSGGEYGYDVRDWKDIAAIAAADNGYVGLKSNGTVVAKGSYSASYSGVENWSNIIDISAGNTHAAGLKPDGTVVASGSVKNSVSEWNNIVAISSGDEHLVGLRSDGTVVGAGRSSEGQLDFSHWKDIVAIKATNYFTAGLKSDGTVIVVGDTQGGQKNVSDWTDIVSVSAGEKHILGLKKDGTVIAQGGSGYGQAYVSNWSDIVQISAGRAHSLGVKKDGTVVSAGNTGNGERKVDGWTDIVQVSAGDAHSVGLKRDGTVVAAGYGYDGQTRVEGWADIVQVSAGEFFTVGVRADGQVEAVGQNDNGQINVGNWNGIKEVATGTAYTVGLKNDGTVVATGVRSELMDFAGWKNIKAISAGRSHTVGLKSDGTVVATGLNTYGQLNVEDWKDIVAISAGTDVTVGLKSDGTVVTTNWSGETGSAAVTVDKPVAKPGDTIHISLKNNRYYTAQSREFSLSGSVNLEGQLEQQADGVLGTSYLVKESDVGKVAISLPGTTDSFGNPIEKKELFQVVPLRSIASSKSEAKPGEKVTLTATFYQPVNPDFKLSLNGAVQLDGVSMTEVSGSNGMKFIYQYTVPADYNKGAVHATLKTLTLTNGSHFDPYTEQDVFIKSNRTAPVTLLTVSKERAKLWDKVTITAKFSEKVKNGIKLSLEGGAELQEAVMSEVEGSAGKEFTYQYSVQWGSSGSVNAKLTGVYDYAGTFYDVYTMDNLFETDGVGPSVVKLETSKEIAKLGDKVLITATFSEPLVSGAKIILMGGTEYKNLDMAEVPGSNGLEYSLEYTVGELDNGVIQAHVNSFEDEFGNQNTYYVDNLFRADGKIPALVSILSDEKVYKPGDYGHVVAEFSESAKQGVKIKLSGGVDHEEYTMSEVQDSGGKKFELYYEIKNGQYRYVNAELTNVEDMAGNVVSISRPKLFYISDPTNANLTGISLDGEFQLSSEFSPEITEYDAVVPISAGMVTIAANAEDPDAVVSGAGSMELALGDNVRVITVTSKDGTVKEYRLTIKTVDMVKPVFEGITDMTISAGNPFDRIEGIKAVDAVDGDLTAEVEVSGTFDPSKPGQYILQYTVSDKAGNTETATRNITVVDDQKPVISGAGDQTIFVNSSFDPRAGVKAEDNVDIDLTSSVVVEGSVNVKAAGTYPLTYKVTDSSENETVVVRKITVVLAAPANVKTAASSYNSVNVSWSDVSGANGYEVYRSTSSTGNYASVGTTTSTSLTNSSLATNTVYYYKVKAYQTVGTAKVYSPESAAVAGKPDLATPASVKAASASYNSIKTSWAGVSGANGYEVYRATSSTGKYSYAGTTTSTSFTNTGLATNYSYYYKVRAYRLVGSVKVFGNFSTTTVTAKPIPSVPISVKAASASYNSIKTSWAGVSGASGYEVYRATSSTGKYSYVGRTSSTSYTNTGLTTNKSYYYKVRAYRLVGSVKVYGNFSGAISSKPVPSIPTSLKAARYSSSSIKLTWSRVSGASGYEVNRATAKTGRYSYVKGTTSYYYINTGLTKKKTYYYKIRTYRVVGKTKIYSGWTTIVSAMPY